MSVATSGLLSQVLWQLPQVPFSRLVAAYQAQRYCKGFTCRMQLTSMLFCHLAHVDSLREIELGLKSAGGKLRHLGFKREPPHSTLADANMTRPSELFRDYFYVLLEHFRAQSRLKPWRPDFRFSNKVVYSLDSTIIPQCLEVLPWQKYGRAKGGYKMHVLLNNGDLLPVLVNISSMRQHDLAFARSLELAAGTIVALDRGYMDLDLFWKWDKEGIFFVTRFKRGMLYKTHRKLQVPEGSKVVSDSLVKLQSPSGRLKYPKLIRRVEVLIKEEGEEEEKLIVLMTNLLDMPAEDIALLYKERWQIELFFKRVKQNLPLKHFIGQSRNAIEIQLWTALIAHLLLTWLQYLSANRWCFSLLAVALRLHLFAHRELEDFLNSPWDPPPEPEEPAQLSLNLR